MAKSFGQRPSAIVGILDPVWALELDNAAAFILMQIEARAIKAARRQIATGDDSENFEAYDGQSGGKRRRKETSFGMAELLANWGHNSDDAPPGSGLPLIDPIRQRDN